MVIWGAICGAVLGLLWPGFGVDFRAVVGLGLGALAGWGLQRAIRVEIETVLARQPVVARPPTTHPVERTSPMPRPLPPRAADFQATTPAPELEPAAAAPAPVMAAPPPRPPGEPSSQLELTVLLPRLRDWLLGGNTVVRMGVLVLFVGLAFLAKYAVEHALLPPELRLAGIGAAGIALFAAGFVLRRRSPDKLPYALTLQGAGVAVLYLAVFAAFRLYEFLPAGAAFAALALICAFAAVIAVAQNAITMALVGFAGGFAAPILVSTGQGNHVGLFSYYLLLGAGIAGLSWFKPWRALNLLGFFATFAVATLWGVLRYRPDRFQTTEPFLIAFFLLYLATSLIYAMRHSLPARRAVDATLIFGTPLVAFLLQAALVRPYEYAAASSSLALGALYVALAWWQARAAANGQEVGRWLGECFAALALAFLTLAVPLALDTRWTSAVWAIEGAAVFWMGRRQERWLARAAGLALQGLAAIAFTDANAHGGASQWPLAHPGFIGGTLLACTALAIAWWSRTPAAPPRGSLAAGFARLEHSLSPLIFWAAFVWWQYAQYSEIARMALNVHGVPTPVYDGAEQAHMRLLAWTGSAFAAHFLALPSRREPWPVAATPALMTLPVMALCALVGVASLQHVFQSWGWIAWPVALALHAIMLRHLDGGRPARWWPWVHAGGVWLLVLLAANLLLFAIGEARLWGTAWAAVILLVAGVLVLLLLSRSAWFAAAHEGGPWPLDRFARSYLWIAAAPLALAVAAGCLLVALTSDGNARPLPYVPLLNPTDLAVALGLAACAIWLVRIRRSQLAVPALARDERWLLAVAASGFVAINTVWLRVAHHYAGVAWDARQLFESFLVQAGYSILWTLVALGLMLGSHRRGLRAAWMVGASLLALTVLKLFVIDLSNRGGSERIFVFIAVGVLMLVVGYFAPLPPAGGGPRGQRLREANT